MTNIGNNPIDILCKEYMEAKAEARKKDILSKQIKDLLGEKGIYNTGVFEISITERPDKYTVDTELLKEKYPLIYKDVCTKLTKGSLILSSVEEL